MKKRTQNSGFTLIEVLFAIVIFIVAALAAADLAKGAVTSTRDAKDMTVATWLLQNVIVELETKIDTEGYEKGCDKKKTGKFSAPYEKYSWVSYCNEIDFKISAAAKKLKDGEDSSSNSPTHEDVFENMILNAASAYLTKSMREIHVEVTWLQGKTPRKIDVTTHLAVYNQPLSLSNTSTGGSK